MGYLDVVVPPDFVAEETSGDVMVPEGGTVRVSCRARGIPTPRVMWRREDGSDIVIRDANGNKNKGTFSFNLFFVCILFFKSVTSHLCQDNEFDSRKFRFFISKYIYIQPNKM